MASEEDSRKYAGGRPSMTARGSEPNERSQDRGENSRVSQRKSEEHGEEGSKPEIERAKRKLFHRAAARRDQERRGGGESGILDDHKKRIQEEMDRASRSTRGVGFQSSSAKD
jgi:hypothetical protein